MAEYIKREYVNEIMFHYARGQEDKIKDLLAIIAQSIYALPNADVVERKRGKWVGGELGYCTCCGHRGCSSDIWTGCYDGEYCPNCGADMKEES